MSTGQFGGHQISVWYIITLLLFAGICHSAETWTGAGSDQNWSTGVNWSGGVPPIGTDVVTFSAAGPGPNIVDTNFTISGLQYIGHWCPRYQPHWH